MQFIGETFLYPVVDGKSLAAPSTTFQYFYPCDGSQVPVVDGDFTGYGDLRPLATALGTDMSVANPVITLPKLDAPAAGLAWFISNVGVLPSFNTVSQTDDPMPVVGEISLLPVVSRRTYDSAEWIFCDGSGVGAERNPALLALLGDTFGGDGTTYCLTPNIPTPLPGLAYAISTAGAVLPLVPVPQGVGR